MCFKFGDASPLFSTIGLQFGSAMPSSSPQQVPCLGLTTSFVDSAINLVCFADYWSTRRRADRFEKEMSVWAAGLSLRRPVIIRGSTTQLYYGIGTGFLYAGSDISPKSDFDLIVHGHGGVEIDVTDSLIGILEIKYVLAGNGDYLNIALGVVTNLR